MDFKSRIDITNKENQLFYYSATTHNEVIDSGGVNTKKIHKTHAIILIKKTEGKIFFKDKKMDLGSSQLFYVPPLVPHNVQINTTNSVYSELILFNDLNMPLPDEPMLFNLNNENYNFIEHIMSEIQDKTKSEYYRYNIIRSLLAWIIEHTSNTVNKGLISPKLEGVINYLRNNKYNYITSKEASKISGMSLTHFNRLFKESFKKSFHQFILDIKIDDAKDLLNDNDISCNQISETLNFSNPSHFSKVFKSRTGFLPKDYVKIPFSLRIGI